MVIAVSAKVAATEDPSWQTTPPPHAPQRAQLHV